MSLLALVVLGSVTLAACAGKGAVQTRYYVLTPVTGDSLAGARRTPPLSVDVADLRLPRYLERPQIVIRSGDNRLVLAEYHQWGGNLAKDMHRTLARNLAALLETPDVVVSPNRPPQPADFRVELEVMQFERDAHGRVRLAAQWRLSRGSDRTELEVRIVDLKSPVVADNPGMEATVSAMSALYGELSEDIARAILEHAAR